MLSSDIISNTDFHEVSIPYNQLKTVKKNIKV